MSNPPRLRDFPGFLRPLVFAFRASRLASEAQLGGSLAVPAWSAARAALRGRLETVQEVLAWSRSERLRRPASSRMEVYTEVVSSSTREALRKLGDQLGS